MTQCLVEFEKKFIPGQVFHYAYFIAKENDNFPHVILMQ